jgi:hypothetical protein
MPVSIFFIIIACVLFVLSVVPKIQQPWMVAIGMAFFSASFLPYFHGSIGN